MSESTPPEVIIHYCRTCGFGVPAEQIAEAVRREFGLSVECRPSWWGCFRIESSGCELFNRWKSRGWLGRLGFGHTPAPAEVVEQLRSLRSEPR
jgi:predicted Rdx family selenoprotein